MLSLQKNNAKARLGHSSSSDVSSGTGSSDEDSEDEDEDGDSMAAGSATDDDEEDANHHDEDANHQDYDANHHDYDDANQACGNAAGEESDESSTVRHAPPGVEELASKIKHLESVLADTLTKQVQCQPCVKNDLCNNTFLC